MAWNESLHPRDEVGRFTFKDGGVGILKGGIEKTEGNSIISNILEKLNLGEVTAIAINVLGKLATPALMLYSDINSLVKSIKENKLENEFKIALQNAVNKKENNNVNNNNQNKINKLQSNKNIKNTNIIANNKIKETKINFLQDNKRKNNFKSNSSIKSDKNYRSILIHVLNNKLKPSEILYSSTDELEDKVREYGLEERINQFIAEAGIGPLYRLGGYEYAKNKYGEDTVGMIDLAHKNTANQSYIKNAIKLNNYKDNSIIKDREYLKVKLTEQFKDYNFDINKISGYYFKSNSEPSKRIASNQDFLQVIKDNKDNILLGKKISGNFPMHNNPKQSNLHYAIGHYDLQNGYVDKQGNLHIKLYDTYDFNKNNMTPLNQAGRNQMLKGNLIPYFTIHDIIIFKNELDKIW